MQSIVLVNLLKTIHLLGPMQNLLNDTMSLLTVKDEGVNWEAEPVVPELPSWL